LWGAVLMCVLLQFAAVYIPFLQRVLRTVPLSLSDWGLVVIFSLLPIVVVEFVKLLRRLTVNKKRHQVLSH
jgi:P-type Ca2+ transporter type 2C